MYNVSLELHQVNQELQGYINEISIEDKNPFYVLAPIEKIAGFFDNINTRLFDILHSDSTDQIDSVKKLNKKADKLIDNNRYLTIKDLTVPVLTGLEIELIRALEYIYKESKGLDKSIDNSVSTTSLLLDKALSEKDFLTSFTPFNVDTTNTSKEIDRIEKLIHLIVNKNSHIDRQPISKLMGNLSVFKEITNTSVKIGDTLNMKRLNKLNKNVESLFKKIEYLKSDVLNKDIDVNKDTLRTIINVIDVTARHITVYTMLFYTYIKIINTIEHIGNVLSDSKLQELGRYSHDTTN